MEAAGVEAGGREGYDTPVQLDAATLKAIIEQTRGEPLVDKPAKLEAWRNGTAQTDQAKFPIELAFRPDGSLDVNDGRHRIALAAERGEKVTAFIDGNDAQRAQELAAMPAVEAAGLTENKVGRKDFAQIAQPESVVSDAAQPWANMTPEQRRRSRLEREIATGMTNNGGVMAKLRPSAIEKRKQELAAIPAVEAAGVGATSGAAVTPSLFSDPRTGATIVVPNKATADAMARSKQLSGKVAVRKATPAEMADDRNAFTGYNAGEARRMGYVLEMLQPQVSQPNQQQAKTQQAQAATENVANNVADVDDKARWLKSVADMNRMSGQFGAQINGVANGRLSVVGNPNATKQGRALMAAVDEARRAGATNEEIAAAATTAQPLAQPQAAPATHADPGQAPEAATPAVVADSLKKAARNEDTKPSEMRKWLVGKIDDAIAVAPEEAVDFLSFDVPGDGTFKVQNSQARLQEFRKKVMASPGFKDGGQKQNTKPLEQVDSARNGSGSTVEAIRNFLADGDVEGAMEFAKLKGVEFTPVPPQMKMSADGKGKVKHMPASVKSSVPSVAEGLTQVEAEQLNQYLTAESARKEPAATQDADVQPSPQDFIPAPDGGLDYGEITPEMGKAMRRQAGKIRLQHGVQNSNGTGWGLVHIEANHGKQISGLGFGSVQDFVAHVASSIQQVWQVPGNSQLLLTLKDGRKDVMYIQLEIAKEGDFYRVNSAFPVRQEDYESLKGMKKIWDGSEPTSAVTGQRPAFATAASASPESGSSQGSSNARGQDASVPPTAPAAQPDTPKLTPAEDGGEKIGGARKAQEDGAKEREAAKSAKRRAERAKDSTETGLRVGIAPGSADPVTVRDGTVYVGKYEAVNYDTGEPVTVPKGSTGEAVAQALKDAGALSRRQRFFGLGEMGDVVMFRVPVMGGLLERPVSHEAVERTVQSILKGIPNAPQVEVHRAPADAGLSIPGAMPKGGVLPDGRIVVFSDANTGVLDVMRTVFHELFHRGLKSYFTSNADYVKFMLDMAAEWPVLRDGAAQWKKSDDGQEKRAEFAKNGPMTGDRLANYEALAVEESLATLSETLRAGSPLQVRTWTRAIGNMLERIARLFGMDKLGDWIHGLNNSELDDFVNAMIARSGNAPVFGSSAIITRYRTTAASIASSMGELTPDQEQAYKNVAGIKKIPTVRERMDSLKANLGLKLRQGLVDQFAAIKQLDQNAYVQARMSKGTDGTLEAMLMYGKPFMRDGAPDVDVKDGGFAKVLASLKGEQDRWMMWIAAQRAEKLKAEGKENLMTDDDISALKTLNAGKMADGTARMPIYAKALAELNEYNDAMLKLAMDSGLIDQAAYDLMAGQPYVPFYRLMEDGDMKGPKFSSGLTNQKAWQKLKGGTQQLNADLLQNMLLNWSHLLQASAKNRAATATMDAAEKMAVAYKVAADTKGAVKVMRDGSAEHWMVEDPYLLDAISAIHYVPSPLMKPLAKFKQLLTWGVTVNPTFKIRNLIRDSVSAIAQSELGYNPGANVAKGWKLTAKDSQIYASMLASGGLMKFGTQENTDRLRAQVAKLGGVVLDKSGAERFFGQIKDLYDVYNEFGDRAENVNRAALYDALIKKGKTHAEAAFMARDLMDFSMGGSAPVVRFLTQAVPFLNARLVGLDKLGRAAMEDPRRFAAVTGAVALASLALMAGYSDDEDWKKREDWDRDAYWWFKIGGQAYRIPKPFEVGAIGTLAERTAELMLSDEMTGKRYMERVSHMLSGTFSFNPVPQAFKPLLDLYANKDSFTGRAIESQADQRLRPQDRYSERTPEVAKFLGGLGLPDPAQLVKGEYSALSPKQVEHLIRGYFSWVGTAAMTVSDFGLRPLAGRGERPDMRLKDVFIAGNFVENLPTGSSRYVTQMYEQSRQVEQAYASYQEAIKAGDTEKAQSIKESAGPLLRNRPAYTAATRQLAEINRTAKRIEADQAMAGAAKRARLTQLEQQRQVIAQRVSRLAAATP